MTRKLNYKGLAILIATSPLWLIYAALCVAFYLVKVAPYGLWFFMKECAREGRLFDAIGLYCRAIREAGIGTTWEIAELKEEQERLLDKIFELERREELFKKMLDLQRQNEALAREKETNEGA